jgi:hypothetical protein
MKITFIADFYTDVIRGGGEIVNDILIDGVERRGCKVTKLISSKVSIDDIKVLKDSTFIIANFVMLKPQVIEALQGLKYVIYEHDHKYLKTRDPSPFRDYVAPQDQIINRDFYKNAIAVFCQSKVHAKVVRQNLHIDNVVNLGCSLWSDDELNVLEKYSDSQKTKKCAVLSSSNKVKGMPQAEAFCTSKNIDYHLIGSSDYEEFIKQLSGATTLAFFSQVLESFCRLVVEARMLNCKLYTNGNNGCVSESWFREYTGKELIKFIRGRREEIIDIVLETIQGKQLSRGGTESITVILNAYRRPYNLRRQIAALRSQTVQPKEIWLWVNDHEDNRGWDYSDLGIDKIFQNNHNWKFYGRFAGALLADTEYVAIFDDDTVPGDRWFENCINTMGTSEGILGSAGVTLNGDRYVQHTRCGWPSQNEETARVDLVGHAWFFKRDWLQYLWREKPTTWDNGEDIQFSYLAQKYAGIQTYCPPHPRGDKSLHGSIMGNELGIDDKATSTNSAISHQQFFSERDFCVQTAIKGGWETVNGIKTS